MAGADLNLSRRALLGAALAAPVLGLDPARHAELVSASSPDAARSVSSWTLKQVQGDVVAKWEKALARFRRAEAALAVADGADEDLFDRLAARCDAAMCRLLRTPAPDAAALAAKLELTIEHLVWEFPNGEACLSALTRDARRLAGRHS